MPNKTIVKGCGLYQEEHDLIEKIAKKYNETPHAIRAYAVRYFLKEYQRGNVKIKTEQKIAKP